MATHLQAAGDSPGGPAKVKEVLALIAHRRQIEEACAAEAQRCRNILTMEVEQHLRDAAQSFLRNSSEDLYNLPPVLQCKDEATWYDVRFVLVKWEHFLESQWRAQPRTIPARKRRCGRCRGRWDDRGDVVGQAIALRRVEHRESLEERNRGGFLAGLARTALLVSGVKRSA